MVSGILNDDPIIAGVAASTVSGARWKLFVRAAAIELPKGLRINVVSPTMLKESESQFVQFFIGMILVEGCASWTSLQTRYLGRANLPRLQS